MTVEEITEKEGWKTTEIDGMLHFETPKGLLSQGFPFYDQAVLAYNTDIIRWRYVRRSALSNLRMVAGMEEVISTVIVDDVVKEWVGIGWIGDEAPTPEDRREYPLAID